MGEQNALTDIPIGTHSHSEMVLITHDVAAVIPPGFSGVCHVFCQHTTAGLTINENADPDVVHDMLHEFDRLVPWRNPEFRHGEGNSAAHVKATMTGSSVTIPIVAGRMALGTWQGIYFCEFDGPRNRHVLIQLIGD